MIRGVVNDRREAVVRLWVRGTAGGEFEIEAVIDTGFTAALALPAGTIDHLGLELESVGDVVLADGSVCGVNRYLGDIGWGDGWRTVRIHEVEEGQLVGMTLLEGHDLRIAVTPGGPVEITPLP